MALHFGPAERAKQFALLSRVDPLRRSRHLACGGDIHHRPHDAG
jgi:hypothetical protein